MTTTSTGTRIELRHGESIQTHSDGRRYVMHSTSNDDDGNFEVFVGVVVDDEGAEYLGCIACEQEIERPEAAMCWECRVDLAQVDA